MTSFTDAIQHVKTGKAVLIDVRTDQEYAAEHAVGARHIDLDQLTAGYDPGFPKDTKIFLYCRSGGRASYAESIFEEMGYKYVFNLGGLCNWVAAGGETISHSG